VITGTEKTRKFYDETGWRTVAGVPVDHEYFGVKEDGPIRQELHSLHIDRIRTALAQGGSSLHLLECGCGGSPAHDFLDLCVRYTGVDFSQIGLRLARSTFSHEKVSREFLNADACALPFPDGVFDAVYSAHMIYHIDDEGAQEKAIAEMRRVVRPGGIVVIVTANPYPLAFPLRLAIRLAKSTPGLGALVHKIRPEPPLPYRPMPINWIRRQLIMSGQVEVFTYALPSTFFNQRVTEYRGLGRLLWKIVRWLDVSHPFLGAFLGNYVTFVYKKR
jgi:SAM-dependent methyltransferase